MSEYSERIRKEWKMLSVVRDINLKQPSDVEVFRNIEYRECGEYDYQNGWNLLDLYVPKFATGKLPVIMSFHGGSYVYGTKEMYQYYLMSLAQRGFAVINFNYRLAPEYKYPTAFNDANCVVEWARKNASQYNLDLDNFFLIGDSAGAHYVSMYTLLCTNSAYSDLIGICPPENFVPKGLGLNCGFYKVNWFFYLVNDIVDAMTDVLGDEAMSKGKMLLNGKSVKIGKFTNVLKWINKDFPPCYVVSGGNDFVKFQVKYIRRQLKKFHINHKAKIYGTRADKDTIHNFHANLECDYSKICNDDECEFFKSLIF